MCINGGCMPQQRKTSSRPAINPASVWLDGLAPTGRRSMRSLLNLSAAILRHNATADSYNWTALRYVHVATLRAMLPEQGYAVATVNMVLAALKGVAQTAFNLGLMDADALARIRAVKVVRGDSEHTGRALSREEVRLLLTPQKSIPIKPARKGSGDTADAVRGRATGWGTGSATGRRL